MFGGNSLSFMSKFENLSIENVAFRTNINLVSKSRGHWLGIIFSRLNYNF